MEFTLGNSTHHAYSILGDGANAKETLFSFLEKSWGIQTQGNPDFSYQKYETFTILEARGLKELQEKKSVVTSGKKIFILDAESITTEAQNALLKVFEEPTENTHFFLLGRMTKNILPTLTSRLVVLEIEAGREKKNAWAVDFLKADVPGRFAMIKKLTDDIKAEKVTKMDAVAAIEHVEAVLYEKLRKENKAPNTVLADLETCRGYASDRSAGIKMILEYMAMIVPVEK